MHNLNLISLYMLLESFVMSANMVCFGDIKDFIDSSNDSVVSAICPICLDPFFNLNSESEIEIEKQKIISEAEKNIQTFVERYSLLACPCSSKHFYHNICFLKWIKNSSSCPQSRIQIDEKVILRLEFDLFLRFFNLSEEDRSGMILHLKNMRTKSIVEIIKIFRSNFPENRLEVLKSLTNSSQYLAINELIKIFEEDENNPIFILNHLEAYTDEELRQVFSFEKISMLSPYQLIIFLKDLKEYTLNQNIKYGSSFLNHLLKNIKSLNSYQQKFSFIELSEMIIYARSVEKNDLEILEENCVKMAPDHSFDPKTIVGFITNNLIGNDEDEMGLNALIMQCFINFYGIDDVDFYKKILSYIINIGEVSIDLLSDNTRNIFKLIMISTLDIEDLFLNVMESMVSSPDTYNQSSKENFIEFLFHSFSSLSFYEFDNGIINLLRSIMKNNDFGRQFLKFIEQKKNDTGVSDLEVIILEMDIHEIQNDLNFIENVNQAEFFELNFLIYFV